MKTGFVIGIMALGAGALVVAPLLSYAGGTVTGTVTYAGETEEKEFFFRKGLTGSKFCPKIETHGHKPDLVKGDKRIIKTIEVGKGGALTAAVVAVSDIDDSLWMEGFEGTEVVVKFCEFLPYTGVVVNGRNLHVENTDADSDDPESVKGVPHTAHAFEWMGTSFLQTIFNVVLPEKGSMTDRKVLLRKESQGSFVHIQCNLHEWEKAFFLPVKNPHYAVTGTDGRFTIENVPVGKRKMIAWHPFAGKVETNVEVTEGTTVTANFRVMKQTALRGR
jgi:hypothetical protein